MGNPHYSPQQKREFRDAFLRHCRNENRKRAYQLTGLEFNVSGDTIEKVIKQFTSGVIDADGVKQVHRGEPRTQIPTAGEPALSLPPVRPAIRDEYNNDITFDAPTQTETKYAVHARTLEIVASDIHFPYEDPQAYAVFIQVVTDLQPDVIVLLGDIMDCYTVSAHDKDPNRATPAAFKDELLYTRTRLGDLRAAVPKARLIYFEGNHETRYSRYIAKNAPILKTSARTIPELLQLNELNIEWIANGDRLRIGKMWHIHGNEIAGGGNSPARLKYQRMQCNFIFGHHHQRDKFRPRTYDGQQHGAYANPCLCLLEAEYLHHAHNWSHGFTIIDHDTDGTFQVEETEIIKPAPGQAKCNVRGKIYISR